MQIPGLCSPHTLKTGLCIPSTLIQGLCPPSAIIPGTHPPSSKIPGSCPSSMIISGLPAQGRQDARQSPRASIDQLPYWSNIHKVTTPKSTTPASRNDDGGKTPNTKQVREALGSNPGNVHHKGTPATYQSSKRPLPARLQSDEDQGITITEMPPASYGDESSLSKSSPLSSLEKSTSYSNVPTKYTWIHKPDAPALTTKGIKVPNLNDGREPQTLDERPTHPGNPRLTHQSNAADEQPEGITNAEQPYSANTSNTAKAEQPYSARTVNTEQPYSIHDTSIAQQLCKVEPHKGSQTTPAPNTSIKLTQDHKSCQLRCRGVTTLVDKRDANACMRWNSRSTGQNRTHLVVTAILRERCGYHRCILMKAPLIPPQYEPIFGMSSVVPLTEAKRKLDGRAITQATWSTGMAPKLLTTNCSKSAKGNREIWGSGITPNPYGPHSVE